MLPNVEILGDVAISPNLNAGLTDVTCFCPTPTMLPDGSIVCSYRRGRQKHSRDGVLVSQKSLDHGRTWLDPVVVYDGMQTANPISVHTGAVCALGGASILAVFTAVEAKDTDAYIFSETGRKLAQQFYVAHSHDGGTTWTAAEPRPLQNAPHNFYIGSRPFVLQDGAVFLPIEATLPGGVEIILGTVSTDRGMNWQPLWTCLADSTNRVGYGDPRFTQLPDGRIVMLAWTFIIENEQTLTVHRCVSQDQGRSWSQHASTGVPSQIMTPLTCGDTRLIAVSNVRTAPEGIRLWQSLDAGESWNTKHPIQMWDPYAKRISGTPIEESMETAKPEQKSLWASLPGFTFGTPELLNLGDQQFLLAYYGTVDGITHVRACRFRILQ